MVINDGIFHVAVTIDAYVVAEHGALHMPAGNDASAGYDGIDRFAAARRIVKHKLRRWILLLPGAQDPIFVIEITDGRHGDEIHIRLIVSIQSAHITPILWPLAVFVHEVIGVHAIR